MYSDPPGADRLPYECMKCVELAEADLLLLVNEPAFRPWVASLSSRAHAAVTAGFDTELWYTVASLRLLPADTPPVRP